MVFQFSFRLKAFVGTAILAAAFGEEFGARGTSGMQADASDAGEPQAELRRLEVPAPSPPAVCGRNCAGRSAFVAGASGAVGRKLVSRLLSDSRYSRVIAAVRANDTTAASFLGLGLGADRSKLRVLSGMDNYTALDLWKLESATVVLTAMGTNIENSEVDNFEHWYQLVDIDFNFQLARLAQESGTLVYGRVGRQDRAWPTKQAWKLWFPAGLINLRPKFIDRGELSKNRPKETARAALPEVRDDSISADDVARRMLREVDILLNRDFPPPVPVVVEHEMIKSEADWWY